MQRLDKNYEIKVNSAHGFELHYKSDPIKKEVTTKEGKITKELSDTETWYFPKLSMALEKYYAESLIAEPDKELLEKVIKIEMNINNFSKTFAKKGRVFEL